MFKQHLFLGLDYVLYGRIVGLDSAFINCLFKEIDGKHMFNLIASKNTSMWRYGDFHFGILKVI